MSTSFEQTLDTLADEYSLIKYNISGVTYDFYFEVEFDVNEHELCIINLKVKVNPSCRREIGDFIESVELARNLHAFFKGFIEYARLNHQRTLLFNALREKYSRLTNSLQRNYLKSKDTKANFVGTNSILKFSDNCQKISPELILLWNLNITPSGHVQPDVQLFAQMPRRKLDEYQLIDQIPHIFHKLVELKGVQIAVEISIQSIFGIEI
ncbi:4122_t:CDS:2 [Diversispora eburnea]|uniref:4122_t:CDS:1 n=1 Tax=Diversispora eburnea TaxID=1213867 RepID=A0A9N8VAS1_9GLOM|nr:4122_t:CDS:2 [Diversispora eburnea]